MSNGNALATVTAAKNAGALVFANMQNLETEVELYKTEVTQITFTDKDFHTIAGKKMPNRAATDKIGEACGVEFIASACRVVTENREDPLCGKRTVYCAEAQGKVRMTDGSWRYSTVDNYEFDPVLRALVDKNVAEYNDQTKPIVAKTIQEYTKVARSRAATGVRLRVIRQLTGMPASFEAADALKPMVFTRVAQNTSYILGTPEGRAMATAQALGVDISTLFGGRKMLDNQPEQPSTVNITPADDTPPNNTGASLANEAAASADPDFPDEPTGPGSQQEETEFMRLGIAIEQLLASYKDVLDVTTGSGKNPYKLAQEELSNQASTEESRRSMRDRLMSYLKAKGINV